MSVVLSVPISGLRRGPIERTWHLDAPCEALGEIPAGIRSVDLSVELTGEGRSGVRARGPVTVIAVLPCRRCLADVDVIADATLDVWFRGAEDVTPGEDGVWPLDRGAAEVDLTEAVREEVWLALPDFIECREACEGLCPGCGARLAEEPCRCPPPPRDPRWAALEGLRTEGGAAGEPSGDA